MSDSWHDKFNPQSFLSRINVDNLITKNEAYKENQIEILENPCMMCRSTEGPGLVLNDKSYLCKSCFENVSKIEYPEKYETLRREYIVKKEAWEQARQSLIDKSIPLKIHNITQVLAGLSLLLLFWQVVLIVVPIILFLLSNQFEKLHDNKLKKWSLLYPEPSQPSLRHFHDPEAELSQLDHTILHIFNHWPGYPPFWSYLRGVVLGRDNNLCQVTGCPSRLELHVHHKKAVSDGGAHTPDNLISLCDFHHALEPYSGHERIWGNIKTRYFTLVCKHTRRNRASEGLHEVRAHLRRLELVNYSELKELAQLYGFACPKCESLSLTFKIDKAKNDIYIECPACNKYWSGPQQLTEETGPRIAELLNVTHNHGDWFARWDMLSQRKNGIWGEWQGRSAVKQRKKYKKKKSETIIKPDCPKCGAPMKLIKPKPKDRWNTFWGCSNYFTTGCRGSATYDNKK